MARIDGAVVVRPTGELIAVGAILKGVGGITGIEGARTTAAIHASHLGTAIKVSEDGVVSLFKDGVPGGHYRDADRWAGADPSASSLKSTNGIEVVSHGAALASFRPGMAAGSRR